jgi:hypothetical protein
MTNHSIGTPWHHRLVTHVFSVQSRDTLWVVADRRLSYEGRPAKEDAVKVVSLETVDGIGVLAYAGLGATPRGTQPSEWMSTVLRGRGRMTFEQTLGGLATVAAKELPRHLAAIPNPSQRSHVIIAPAFINGVGSRLFTIDYGIDTKTGKYRHSYMSHVRSVEPGSQSLRIAAAGSGISHTTKKNSDWLRALRSLVRDHDRGKVSDKVIADQLAALNFEVHEKLTKKGDSTVGPRSIVIWHRRRDARRDRPPGGQLFYDGTNLDPNAAEIPTIVNGTDVVAMIKIFVDLYNPVLTDAGFDPNTIAIDTDEANRRLAALPQTPDDKLR